MAARSNGSAAPALLARIEQLERQLEHQGRELRALRERVVVSPAPPVDEAATPDRRHFVRAAAAAATGAVVGGAALLADASPAAAADGNSLVIGDAGNTGTHATGLAVTGKNAGYGLGVTDNGLASVPASPAVFGHAQGTNFTTAVLGLAQGSSTGVAGAGDTGVGVFGSSQVVGVLGASTIGLGAIFSGGSAALRLDNNKASPPAPPARSDAHNAGELEPDKDNSLWLCVTTGTPGSWRKLAGPTTAGALHVLPSTIRVYDSRPGFAPLGGTKGTLGANQQRVVDGKLGGAVPAGASAVLANLTIVSASGSGFLAAFKNGIAWPGNSTLNWDHAAQVAANSAVVALDASAQFQVRASNPVDYIVDVVGYYR
jgi:hypothetical protein